jgi:feruloyl esterase
VLFLVSIISRAAGATCDLRTIDSFNVPAVRIWSVIATAAVGQQPGYCTVKGSVSTDGDGAGPGTAGFEIKLPENWNHKFLFWGSPGLAGLLPPAANPVDMRLALTKGYATVVTDAGHESFDPSWVLKAPHLVDQARLVDYWYRATHAVTVTGKALVERFYARAIERAYFDGCSNGGRMGLMEAMRYPDDYDGVIAGAPWLDLRTQLAGYKNVAAFCAHFIPRSLLTFVSQAVLESCDAADGVADGLIQNPARCGFDPYSLVCKDDQTGQCLSIGQAEALSIYFRAVIGPEGQLIFPGQPVSDLSDENGFIPWVETQPCNPDMLASTDLSPLATAWLITKAIARFAGPAAPQFVANTPNQLSDLLAHFLGRLEAPIAWGYADWNLRFLMAQDPRFRTERDWPERGGIIHDDFKLRRFDQSVAAGNVDRPERLAAFLRRGGKIILYHGFSDPGISPFRTISFYQDLALQRGGYAAAQEQVRLFMVPGMLHCGDGSGPNLFDTLSSLERWVETGAAPDGIIASRSGDGPDGVPRSMPLCAFPDAALYKGTADVKDAHSWSCTTNSELLQIGPNGRDAGLDEDAYSPRPR